MPSNTQYLYTDPQVTVSLRNQMVSKQIVYKGIQDPRVLSAMRAVPRHWFVPAERQQEAYEDRPLPIGHGQTISQPFMVAKAAECLELQQASTVLEIGAGSGYQAAVLAPLCHEVVGIEWHEALVQSARAAIDACGISNVQLYTGDGKLGFPGGAPWDRILVSCACAEVPGAWWNQLAPGGLLVFPLILGDSGEQSLVRWTKALEPGEPWSFKEELVPVRYVPLL